MSSDLENLSTECPDLLILGEESFEGTKQNNAYIIKPVIVIAFSYNKRPRFTRARRREEDQDLPRTGSIASSVPR